MTRARPAAVLFAVLASAGPASAHEFDPGVLVIVEQDGAGGVTHRYRLTLPVDTRGPERTIRLRFPEGCVDEPVGRTLRCAPGAFAGPLVVEGLSTVTGRASMVVSLRRRDGTTSERVVDDDRAIVLAPSGGEVASTVGAWVWLGAQHLLTGPDHLAFLVGLMALVRRRAALVAALTTFSLGHSLSLGLSVSGWLRVPVAPTEALIALSVAQVAAEALRGDVEPTLLGRAPYVVTLLFGLVHGLGFASALGDRGFPREGLLGALAAFHAGIELAQLGVVAAVSLGWWLLSTRRARAAAGVRRAALYAVGSLGACWTIDRVVRVVAGAP